MVVRRVSELGTLLDAERTVLSELDTGAGCVLGDGSIPNAGDEIGGIAVAEVLGLFRRE